MFLTMHAILDTSLSYGEMAPAGTPSKIFRAKVSHDVRCSSNFWDPGSWFLVFVLLNVQNVNRIQIITTDKGIPIQKHNLVTITLIKVIALLQKIRLLKRLLFYCSQNYESDRFHFQIFVLLVNKISGYKLIKVKTTPIFYKICKTKAKVTTTNLEQQAKPFG